LRTDTARLGLLIYESTLTFPEELKLIWTNVRQPGAMLYLLARYCSILYIMAVYITDFLGTDPGMTVAVRFDV